MPDVIKLLPESVANQIAAGEVIQRPASAVKELLENSVDAGATDIKLFVKDSGRSLIQVNDNGCGMSLTDARLAFERHATSKIREANDLFAIRTLGFRGEALASIAAIAQIQIKTRRHEDELGTLIEIEGADFKQQSPCSCPAGTSIAVKNLFFNVPARRNFLKSNTVEFRHIIEEFQRVALVYPEISFSLYNDDRPMFVLQATNLKQRIINLMGNHFLNRLIPIEEENPEANIIGFIGKPEFAKKTRGEQYFFVNKRFIRNAYMHHAVDSAYKELIPDDSHPVYFIHLDVNPENIDVNIHPTKTEVNFRYNQVIYSILKSSVKKALGKFSLEPTLDFDKEQGIEITPLPPGYIPKQPEIKVDPEYNPFSQRSGTSQFQVKKTVDDSWKSLFPQKTEDQASYILQRDTEEVSTDSTESNEFSTPDSNFLIQLNARYIVAPVKSGLMLIDQYQAHQRILYDKLLERLSTNKTGSQKSMFPQTVHFSPANADIVKEILPQLNSLGFEIESLGVNTYVVSAIPGDSENEDINELLEKIIDNYKKNLIDLKSDRNTNLARSMAKQMAIKPGKILGSEEMMEIINQLFASKAPEISPDGSPTLRIITLNEINKKFRE
ncbi:MAG: DNA mismatch repair endonuclease MutL [Bacteroidales bacterium]